ncbi:protein bark beetle [Hetaerina americana]|uniref:protein bark beetle n=1 Tax=Hetaerina americana TaxID=62018 RepID=UPI003A7F1E56
MEALLAFPASNFRTCDFRSLRRQSTYRTLWVSFLYLLTVVSSAFAVDSYPGVIGSPTTVEPSWSAAPSVVGTVLPGGPISSTQRLTKDGSPYLVRGDIVVEKPGELRIDAGVTVRFQRGVGLTVRGVLLIQGKPEERVVLTSDDEPQKPSTAAGSTIRLVDGPTPLVGRVQILHNDEWRSVCTNSRNWTRVDIDVACREMGFGSGGFWWSWLDQEMGVSRPRLLYQEPSCKGTEKSVTECNWGSRQMGSGTCDYHPDLGIACHPFHSQDSVAAQHHWRGIHFDKPLFSKPLVQENTLYVFKSKSVLENVDIKFAGSGKFESSMWDGSLNGWGLKGPSDGSLGPFGMTVQEEKGVLYKVTSAIEVVGIPPRMVGMSVQCSAYNGLNITRPEGPVHLHNCTVRNNQGYGVYVNSSTGLTLIENSFVSENGADGVKYVHHDEIPDRKIDSMDVYDFCTFPTTNSQTFPISIFVEQNENAPFEKNCVKYFMAREGQILTLHFLQLEAESGEGNVGLIKVFDGSNPGDRLIASVSVKNGTWPQSISTTRNRIFISFSAQPKSRLVAFMKLTSSYSKSYDLNVTSSVIADNNGRGIAAENLRSQLHVHLSSVSNNAHVAGIHVLGGAADVNVTESRIAFNKADGINITYAGGSQNISRSFLSSNKGRGISVWLNETSDHLPNVQETVVYLTEVFKNHGVGVLVGNYCIDAKPMKHNVRHFPLFTKINISSSCFNDSSDTAIEIWACRKEKVKPTILQIGHNTFTANKRLGVKLTPAVNLEGFIEHNRFTQHSYGGLLIRNPPEEETLEVLPAHLTVNDNEFMENEGVFAVSLGLSPYAEDQKLLFTRNFVRDNRIREPFKSTNGGLLPRSKVAAPVVISSSNVEVFRNIIENPSSEYEVGSHLRDQSQVLNVTFNWLGSDNEGKIFSRLFHRPNRYDLARIKYIPYLLHGSNPASETIISQQMYVPRFYTQGLRKVGGEVDGIETLPAGEYLVEKDINIRPGGRLTIRPGVTLNFAPSTGMMVAGKLEARGRSPNDILLTLDVREPSNDTADPPVRLLGGRTSEEGRLQVRNGQQWGTVCNYGWTIKNAALVCHQLGLALNPDDWLLEPSEIPEAGTTEDIILSNVACTEEDMDITKCNAEMKGEFENSCSHEHDVGLRCHSPTWAGVRISVLAERSDLQYLTIEKAGLLDYSTNYFKPALQIDFSRHSLNNIRVVDNVHDGLGIVYSDIYSKEAINTVIDSEFKGNRGSGISLKQLGMQISGSRIEDNGKGGISHNPFLSLLQQRELAGWFEPSKDIGNWQYRPYSPIYIPKSETTIELEDQQTKYIITQRVRTQDEIKMMYHIRCKPGFAIGVQLLNPIHNRSTEEIIIYDTHSLNSKSEVWNVKRDLVIFPTVSSSFGIIMEYRSGFESVGGTVFAITSMPVPPSVQHRYHYKPGPIPILTVKDSRIKGNKHGFEAFYYNRYINEIGDIYLRKANESINIVNCDISHNKEHAVYVYSPFWDIHYSNLSEITFMINSSLITDNGKGIYHFSRDMRSSNNLFHWILQDNTIERNNDGGFDISLPYVWQYNENYTHSFYLSNNTFRNNKNFGFIVDGHFAELNMTRNTFNGNKCKVGLISVRGMEKKMKINYNKIENNFGKFMVEFNADSQSEILGHVNAVFFRNEVQGNQYKDMSVPRRNQERMTPSFAVGFHGIQRVRVNRNILGNNSMDYELLCGVKTSRIHDALNMAENWWGTADVELIREKIFDFDDWNGYAAAAFRPYLVEPEIDGSTSLPWEAPSPDMDENGELGGSLPSSLTLYARDTPYIVRRDITVMPMQTLTIAPGVHMEFAPGVGILVLGTLRAQGMRDNEIEMRPLKQQSILQKSMTNPQFYRGESASVRLCTNQENCTRDASVKEGFLEYYNQTTRQWVPLCDSRFTERNAEVVCRELGFDGLNAHFYHGERVEFHPNSLSRIWSWPEPLQCSGNEGKLEECPIRLNGQLYGHIHRCLWNSKFVFIHCGERNLPEDQDYWGGIRFANPDFEQNLYEHRVHDVVTHQTIKKDESVLQFVRIIGAGILHNEKTPAVQSIGKSPVISNVNISKCASDGFNVISPTDAMKMLFNRVEDVLGIGLSAISLTGEGRESDESSFTPIKEAQYPYNLFSMIDMCDPTKEVIIEERVLVYYKYVNNPVNCVKIFNSVLRVKPFGFRLLQFNLFNSTHAPGRPDTISLYDGDIYNITTKLLSKINVGSKNEKRFFQTSGPSLSIKLFANGASSRHGFIAEVVTLPISAIGFNRDVQHNVSYSVFENNQMGAVSYASAGEINPMITMEWNRFSKNCLKLYGNFSSCSGAISMDIQNTQSIFFKNNLVQNNQGGLSIRADSRGSATALKGYISNNLFRLNKYRPAVLIEGRRSSPYQEVTLFRNYFAKNYVPYDNVIILKQVVSNFTYNYVHNNIGRHILEVSGFEKVRLPIYQTTSHNGFYWNYAVDRDERGTIVAGTAGQHYVDNVLVNPDNDYEIVTVNRSLAGINSSHDVWKSAIDAKHNWWGYNGSITVGGRIKDRRDEAHLLEVDYEPFHMNNLTLLGGKCPPGWNPVGDTCYIYVGVPMNFTEAREFCRSDNASMPYVMSNYVAVYHFLREQQERFSYYDKVWVQNIDMINRCTVFGYQNVMEDQCERLYPFICEQDPKVFIDPLSWTGDVVTIGVIGAVFASIILVALVAGFWYTKSRHRHVERLERRNSIRASMRSLASSHGGFNELGYRRKQPTVSRPSPTPTKMSEYKKMNGSIDSMDKSQFNSSIEDNQSYDIYEAHNPNALPYGYSQFDRPVSGVPPTPSTTTSIGPSFDLAYRNEGFRDNSTFASRELPQIPSAGSTLVPLDPDHIRRPVMAPPPPPPPPPPPLVAVGNESPGSNFNSSTLPLDYSLMSDSTLDMKHDDPTVDDDEDRELQYEDEGNVPYGSTAGTLPMNSHIDYFYGMPPQNDGGHAGALLETDLDQPRPVSQFVPGDLYNEAASHPSRSKSEALLETNFDYIPTPSEYGHEHFPLSSRSKSQPLETAM